MKYQAALTETLSQIRESEASVIAEGNEKHNALFSRLGKLTVFYRYLVERGVMNQAPFGVQILYAKISNCLVSTEILLRAGYAGPAAMVLRSLFEAMIHLELILEKDVEARAQLFLDFQHIEVSSTFSVKNDTEEIQRSHLEALKAVRGNYRPDIAQSWCWKIVKAKRNGRGGVPADPSLKDVCNHLGMTHYYEKVYGKVSAAVHPVPSYALLIQREGEGRVLEVGPHFGGMINAMGELALVFGTKAFLDVLKFLSLPDSQQLFTYLRMELDLLFPGEKKAFES